MRFWLLIIISNLIQFSGHAQYIENFENWDAPVNAPPFEWSNPTGWTTTNPVTEFIGSSVEPSTDSYTGAFSALIKSHIVFGAPHAGELNLGDADIDFMQLTIDPSQQGISLDQEPSVLYGWYKNSDHSPDCPAAIQVRTSRYEQDTSITLMNIIYDLPVVQQYTLFEIPISWNESYDKAIHQLSIRFYSQNNACTSGNAQFYLDDLTIDFSSQTKNTNLKQTFTITPNPVKAAEGIYLNFNSFLPLVSTVITLYDSGGRAVHQQRIEPDETFIDTHGLNPGLYFIKVLGISEVQKVSIL